MRSGLSPVGRERVQLRPIRPGSQLTMRIGAHAVAHQPIRERQALPHHPARRQPPVQDARRDGDGIPYSVGRSRKYGSTGPPAFFVKGFPRRSRVLPTAIRPLAAHRLFHAQLAAARTDRTRYPNVEAWARRHSMMRQTCATPPSRACSVAQSSAGCALREAVVSIRP
jgi:hypothetical protein